MDLVAMVAPKGLGLQDRTKNLAHLLDLLGLTVISGLMLTVISKISVLKFNKIQIN